jgi:hypothetical protein
MKASFLLIAICFFSFFNLQAQLKQTTVCPPFEVDVLEGTVNRLFTYSSLADVEQKFPCFTGVTPETNGSTCGGVFFKDRDVSFFTERNYIEIGEHFKGKISLPLLGAARGSLFSTLGNPSIKDVTWDAYQTKYGILILYYNKANKINKLQMSNRNAATLKLCE